ncbi:YbgA family protein [Nitrospira sp. M1]
MNSSEKNERHTLPRLGISQCLLGEQVRYDGGHKRDRFLTTTLAPCVEWIPVCPEVEAGLGIPREAMRLVGPSDEPRLVTIKTKKDHTMLMQRFSQKKIRELSSLHLDGFIFKKNSPSCGIQRVRLYNQNGIPHSNGVGLFAQAFHHALPTIPIEDEGRLQDTAIKENFIERVFCSHRWNTLIQQGLTRGAIVQFHTHHKYLLLAHSRPHYQELGHLVASAKSYTPKELALAYRAIFMEALKVKATVRKHVNVLQHLLGHLKKQLRLIEKQELQEVIDDYHRQLTPLTVPLTLMSHYVRIFDISYLADQVYLHPHPKELMLRNHV